MQRRHLKIFVVSSVLWSQSNKCLQCPLKYFVLTLTPKGNLSRSPSWCISYILHIIILLTYRHQLRWKPAVSEEVWLIPRNPNSEWRMQWAVVVVLLKPSWFWISWPDSQLTVQTWLSLELKMSEISCSVRHYAEWGMHKLKFPLLRHLFVY